METIQLNIAEHEKGLLYAGTLTVGEKEFNYTLHFGTELAHLEQEPRSRTFADFQRLFKIILKDGSGTQLLIEENFCSFLRDVLISPICELYRNPEITGSRGIYVSEIHHNSTENTEETGATIVQAQTEFVFSRYPKKDIPDQFLL